MSKRKHGPYAPGCSHCWHDDPYCGFDSRICCHCGQRDTRYPIQPYTSPPTYPNPWQPVWIGPIWWGSGTLPATTSGTIVFDPSA